MGLRVKQLSKFILNLRVSLTMKTVSEINIKPKSFNYFDPKPSDLTMARQMGTDS